MQTIRMQALAAREPGILGDIVSDVTGAVSGAENAVVNAGKGVINAGKAAISAGINAGKALLSKAVTAAQNFWKKGTPVAGDLMKKAEAWGKGLNCTKICPKLADLVIKAIGGKVGQTVVDKLIKKAICSFDASAICEVIGLGPEDPAADACAVFATVVACPIVVDELAKLAGKQAATTALPGAKVCSMLNICGGGSSSSASGSSDGSSGGSSGNSKATKATKKGSKAATPHSTPAKKKTPAKKPKFL